MTTKKPMTPVCEHWYECKHCGWRVYDLCCRTDIEWWSEDDCGWCKDSKMDWRNEE